MPTERQENRRWVEARLAEGDVGMKNRIKRIGMNRYLDFLEFRFPELNLVYWRGNDEFKAAYKRARDAFYEAALLQDRIVYSSEDDPDA